MTATDAHPAALDSDRLARVGFSRVVDPGDSPLVRLLAATSGDVAAAWALLRGDGRLPDGVADHVRSRAREIEPERDLTRGELLRARFVVPGDEEWPARLLDPLEAARTPEHRAGVPLGLWVRGEHRLDEFCDRAVAVVGSRSMTAYGERVADELGTGLADRGWTVVSGAASGVDAVAHRGALAVGGPTLGVLACGVDVFYPSSNHALIRRIVEEGLLVSEWPPGMSQRSLRFLSRNRIIAALSAGTVIVEAAMRSGSKSTLGHARRLGRVLMTVPGPVTSSMSAGCNQLLRQDPGVVVVTCAAEVVESVGALGADLAPLPQGASDPRDALGEDARRLLDVLLKRRPRSADHISASAGLHPRDVAALIPALVAQGWVERIDGGFRLAADAGG